MIRNRLRENYITRYIEQGELQTICTDLRRFKEEFQNVLEDDFRHAIETEMQRNNFDWSRVKQFYNTHKNIMSRLWSLKIFCSFVLDLFYTFNCTEDKLIKKIIYIYNELLNEYKTLDICSSCKRSNYPKHYHTENFKETRTILLRINRISLNTYRFTNREFYSTLTTEAINFGDYMLLKFLVNYGLSYSPENRLIDAKIQLNALIVTHRSFIGLDESEGIDFAEKISNIFADVTNSNAERIYLILQYISVCLRKRLDDNYYEDYVKCLNLYSLTVPDVAISKKDVKDFLNLVFSDDIDFIIEICFRMNRIFPEVPSLSTPRSLKHLCRCSVRDRIQKHPSLSAVLSEMDIPMTLKEYLLIE